MSYSKREAVMQYIVNTDFLDCSTDEMISDAIHVVERVWDRIPATEPKPKKKADPLVSLLKNKLGCGVQQSRNQIKALREAGWGDEKIVKAIHEHATPGTPPWDWTKKVMSMVQTRKEPDYDPFE